MPLASPADRPARPLLILAGLVTVVAWQFPLGRQLLYPFTLLATYAHEMGHGLTAALLGGRFDALELHPDGSGLAAWSGELGRIGRGLVAAGGLVGPSVAGALLLVGSRRTARARALLGAMALAMLLSLLLVARSPFAVLFIGSAALVLGGVARGLPAFAPFLVQLLGVQLCLAVFRDLSYMFSAGAVVDGVSHPSDSAAIAQALFLPYWFWGGATAAFSFLVLALGLRVALRDPARAR